MPIYLETSYYASLGYHALDQLGLMGGPTNPQYQEWSKRLMEVGKAFNFEPPVPSGPIFPLLYQIPGDLNPADRVELQKVFTELRDFVHTRSTAGFKQRWPERTQHWDKFHTPFAMQRIADAVSGKEADVIKLLTLFEEFLLELWPHYMGTYHEKLKAYPFAENEAKVRKYNPFTFWEEQFGEAYPYDDFHVIICPESTSAASSLGPEKIVYGSRIPAIHMENAVVHEIGVRFPGLHRLEQHPATREIAATDYMGLVKCIEAEICFRKPRIMPNLERDVFNNPVWAPITAWRKDQTPPETSIPEMFAYLYQKAKTDGLLGS